MSDKNTFKRNLIISSRTGYSYEYMISFIMHQARYRSVHEISGHLPHGTYLVPKRASYIPTKDDDLFKVPAIPEKYK